MTAFFSLLTLALGIGMIVGTVWVLVVLARGLMRRGADLLGRDAGRGRAASFRQGDTDPPAGASPGSAVPAGLTMAAGAAALTDEEEAVAAPDATGDDSTSSSDGGDTSSSSSSSD